MNTESVKSVKFATQIDADVLKELKEVSAELDQSISRIVTEAVADYLKKIRVRPAFRSAMTESIAQNAELYKRLAK